MPDPNEKLLISRATRIRAGAHRPLNEIERTEGLKPAQVDRAVLEWFAEKVAGLRRQDQGLLQFLQTLRIELA
jgi:hypothetical protein